VPVPVGHSYRLQAGHPLAVDAVVSHNACNEVVYYQFGPAMSPAQPREFISSTKPLPVGSWIRAPCDLVLTIFKFAREPEVSRDCWGHSKVRFPP
jgi:hypothetical protein